MKKNKVSKKERKQQKEFKQLVWGKPRRKKGKWDVMYGGQPDLDTKKKKRNFWVDTDIFFKQD